MGIDAIRKTETANRYATWVIRNEHSVREVALIFFILAVFAGVVWLTGRDVEPVTFMLGSICTLLYVSPKLARYVVPDRKPVRDMSYDEILDFISMSDARLDWKWIATKSAQEAFLKEDPRLRIRVRFDDEGIHQQDFTASWMAAFSEPEATSYWFDLSYDHALIDRFILVSVDDGQAELPVPVPDSLEVEPLNYKVAEIFDQHNTLETYMSTAGLELRKEERRPW